MSYICKMFMESHEHTSNNSDSVIQAKINPCKNFVVNYDQIVKAASFKMNTFLKEFFTIIIKLSYLSLPNAPIESSFSKSNPSINACKTISMKFHYWTILHLLKVMSSS